MGWKKFKEHFGIKHIVQVEDGKLQIGSGYVSDLVSVDMKTGNVWENRTFTGFLREHYPMLHGATAAEITSIIAEPDTFSTSITVYTSGDGEIIEKQCEATGWPNVTHDGELMHDNTFFVDKDLAVSRAKESARCYVRITESSAESARRNLAECVEHLEQAKDALARLEAQYPGKPEIADEPDDNKDQPK